MENLTDTAPKTAPRLSSDGLKKYAALLRGFVSRARTFPAPFNSSAPAYDAETLAECAACLWESVLDADPGATPEESATGWRADMQRTARVCGIAAMRADVIRHAEAAESGWRLAQAAGFDAPFDWEFIPDFVAGCIDWKTGGGSLVSDWRDICKAMGANSGEAA